VNVSRFATDSPLLEKREKWATHGKISTGTRTWNLTLAQKTRKDGAPGSFRAYAFGEVGPVRVK
jgi:hypothetical protein